MPFHRLSTFAVAAMFLALACSSSTTTPGGATATNGDGGADAMISTDAASASDAPDPLVGCTRDPGAPAPKNVGSSDPTGDATQFTIAKALEGFPASASGALTAAISTEKGTIVCRLSEADAPVSVANFVGLARGTRPYQATDGSWKTGRFYDGKTWHRVIPNFVIQGGDPLGTGTGGPGYALPQENHAAEVKGTLAMAASSAPSGSQFYIVIGKGPANDYNVFGLCDTELASAIADVPVDAKDKPKTPEHMLRIDIGRCP